MCVLYGLFWRRRRLEKFYSLVLRAFAECFDSSVLRVTYFYVVYGRVVSYQTGQLVVIRGVCPSGWRLFSKYWSGHSKYPVLGYV